MASPHFDFQAHDATFGATVTGLRLATLSASAFDALYDLWLDRALLVFPGQQLTGDQQQSFAQRFGKLELKLAPLSNVRRDGTLRADDGSDEVMHILRGNMDWHADSTYMPVQAKGAVFTAHTVPPSGGETGWADMRAAYAALPGELRTRVEALAAYHSLYYSQRKVGHKPAEGGGDYNGYGFHGQEPPLRPLVKTHPETGVRSLLIGRHAYGIPGLSDEESERLLDDLVSFACQPPRVLYHRWAPGDAVLWDNRCLLHRACPWDTGHARVMYHSRIAGDPVSEYAAHV